LILTINSQELTVHVRIMLHLNLPVLIN
jgi:hypothetical protein